MSHFRRLATAGMALACAGIFIGAPAQAATAHPAASAKAAEQTAARSVGRTATPGYKSFSSTAKSAGHTSVTARSVLPYSAQATASNIIYVVADVKPCTTELGAGTNADPYCLLQSAVNAAVAGDTIEVFQDYNDEFGYHEDVTVNGKTDLTILGEGTGVGDAPERGQSSLEIQNSSNITVENLTFSSTDFHTVQLYSSSGITLNGDNLLETGSSDDLVVGAGMSDTKVTRSTLDDNGYGLGTYAGWVENGAQNTVLASDVIMGGASGVKGYDVSGLDVVGDTFNRGCSSDVDISNSSTGVSIEDNVYQVGSLTAATCTTESTAYAPVVSVDASSVAGTTSDYNDFNFSADSTAAYSWNGTTYATLAAFQAAVSQGAHDLVDPTADLEMFLSPDGMNTDGTTATVDAVPTAASLSVGTANTAAPGYLTTDFHDNGSYADRGALKYVAPALTAALTDYQDGARTVLGYADASVESDAYATYAFNWGDGTTTAASTTADVTHTFASPGIYSVTVTVTDVYGDTSSATVSTQTAGSDYTPVGPVRVLDTRKGTGTNGVIASVGSKQTLALKIAGVGSVPATATAVALNVTVTDTKGYGFITAYAAGSTVPITSNVNFSTNQTVANMTIVPIGTDGTIDLYNGGTGSVDLVADEAGYFTPAQADGFASFTPVRLLDTRTTTGGHNAPLTEADPVKLKVAGVGGVPADVKAVAVNLTVASPTLAGYIRAFPDAGTVPGVSNVNFSANQVIANAAIIPVGSDGDIDVTLTGSGSLRMIVDVDGYFSANTSEAKSAYEPVTPFRFLDTRTIKNGTLQAGYYYSLPIGTDFWGNPMPSVTGTVTNATVTQTTATSGDLIAFPDKHASNGDLVIPSTSTLNFTQGATVPNLAITAPGSDGDVDYLNQSAGNLQLIVDVSGYFQNN